MPNSPQLDVYMLGPLRVQVDQRVVTGWRYLDSPELLAYLMLHTREFAMRGNVEWRGETKEQITAALVPNASSAQADTHLKARLHDLRQHLGARDWIVFEDGQYKFNYARSCTFDVRAFERAVADAEHELRAKNVDAARARFQDAVKLYRGDFLNDYRKRRTAEREEFRDDDEIEWYVQKRYELQALYRRALEQLGALLLEAARNDDAAETFRLLVALDDYDDAAHRQLMLALARQGKRSQALQHFRRLLKQRADTPPEEELVQLAEQIKRGEISAPAPVNAAASVPYGTDAVPFPLAETITPTPFQAPADLPRFVGRDAQFEWLQNEILRAEIGQMQAIAPPQGDVSPKRLYDSSFILPPSSFALIGMGGIGKTSLAIHLAHALREQFSDGVLWGHLATSEPLAILDSWARAFGCDYSGLPDLASRGASLRSLLADKKILFVLDDVRDVARARPLLLNGQNHRVIITTRDADLAAAFDAHESADLLRRIVGETRVEPEQDAVTELCALLGHLPLALDITARRLASRPRWTLREMVERLRVQVTRLDELQMQDRAVRVSFAISWDALSAELQRAFAHVGAFEGRSFTAPAFAFVIARHEAISPAMGATKEARESSTAQEIASSHNPLLAMTMRDELDALVALSLLAFEGDARYRQHPLLADFAREKLAGTYDPRHPSPVTLTPAHARLATYYLQFAVAQRHNYLALEDEWDNLTAGIEIAHAQNLSQAVIDYGDVLTDAWFARGRFSDARRAYPRVMAASRALEEQDPYIAASLNWGKACIDQGAYAEAEEHLQHGLQTSREVSDEYGIGTALFLLARVAVERSEYDAAQKYLEESQRLREKLGDRAGVAETLYMQGRIKYLYRDFVDAKKLGSRALELQETFPPNHARVVTLRWLARTADWLEHYEAAETYGQQALAMSKELNDLGEFASALYDLSDIFRRQRRITESRDYAENSQKMFRMIGDRKAESFALEGLSKLSAELNQLEAALAYGFASLKLARELDEHSSLVRLLFHLGNLHHGLGRLETADQMWSEALPIAERLEHPLSTSLRERLI